MTAHQAAPVSTVARPPPAFYAENVGEMAPQAPELASQFEAFDRARGRGDTEAMAAAALSLASHQRLGEPAGRLPALLHQAYLAATGEPAIRVRLAAALARSWAYANDAPRGVAFAEEAVALADALEDHRLLADALDAHLATCWGPDELDQRLHITARLADVVAHLDDERPRLDAHLWRLTTALETLDVTGVHRQLAALRSLAEETRSPTVRYFLTTRRAMHALLVGDHGLARLLITESDACGAEAQIPDAVAVHHALVAELARQSDDAELLHDEAMLFEQHATDHGIQSLLAEAAVLWLESGDPDRAGRLAVQASGAGLSAVPRDFDFLLTVSKVTEAASGAGDLGLAQQGLDLLAPYVGRAVVNGGAVNCQGVVEDYLFRAAAAVGDPRAEGWRAAAATAYRRLAAPGWLRRVAHPVPPSRSLPAPRASTLHLRPLPGGTAWLVGPDGGEHLLPDLRGMHYLRALIQRPGAELSALELTALVSRQRTTIEEGDTGALFDRQSLVRIRTRLAELDDELATARDWADPDRISALTVEREALLDEIGRATGLGGRRRTTGGSAERARVAVRKAIAAALARIEVEDPATARVLRASVHTGLFCRFDPDPDSPLRWSL